MHWLSKYGTSKAGVSILAIALMLLSTHSFAQSFFGSPSKKQTGQTQVSTPPPNQVMSKEAFRSTVSGMGKQSKDSLKQQVNQNLSKAPPPPKTGTITPPSPTPTSKQMEATAPPPVSKPLPAQAPQTPQVPPSPPETPVYSGFSSQEQTTPVKPVPSSQGQSQQPYTGFGGGQGAGTTTNSSGSSSSGWNVNY